MFARKGCTCFCIRGMQRVQHCLSDLFIVACSMVDASNRQDVSYSVCSRRLAHRQLPFGYFVASKPIAVARGH